MIARSWDGITKAAQADEYTDYVRRTGVTDFAATDGNLGVYLFRRREGDRARFRVLSLWDSMEDRRFAVGLRGLLLSEDGRF
jgi:heme-degrading monooxygenase HmoA